LNIDEFGYYWLAFFGIIVTRYFLVAGVVYWYFYMGEHHLPKLSQSLRSRPVSWKLIRHDMELSVGAAVLFGLGATTITNGMHIGATMMYPSIAQYGWGYLFFSYLLVLIAQDTYFYFLHRAFHHSRLFKWIHQGHHRSGDPTPWTSFAFDPLEVIFQSVFLVAVVYVMPLHISVLLALLMTMTIWSVWNHLGFELFSPAFPRHWLSRWFIGPTHHAIHHRKYHQHYGLYFTVWDRLMGTHDPAYDRDFASALKPRQ
jgi:sterol desaturase/sphingolipid hydroxylase (fatty acid hydroxylase superfamily)